MTGLNFRAVETVRMGFDEVVQGLLVCGLFNEVFGSGQILEAFLATMFRFLTS